MATLSHLFRQAVDELLSGSKNSRVPMEEIILLSKSHSVDGVTVAPGTDDCTEALQGALRWGLRKYGLDLYCGYAFFVALVELWRILPHT